MTIFLIIVAVYVAGAFWTAPRFARRGLANHRRDYPILWGGPDTERYRREYAGIGLGMSLAWPVILPGQLIAGSIYNRAYAEDLAAEAELDRAKTYAKAREILRKSEEKDRRAFDRKMGVTPSLHNRYQILQRKRS